MKKHSKAFVFFAVSKQIPVVYSADRCRAEMKKFPFKKKGLTSHNVKFLKCLLENDNGQLKVDNKRTILHLFNHSESPSSM